MARPKGAKSNPDRRHLPFKQSEVERALRAAEARGISVGRIEVETRGGTKISIIPAAAVATPDQDDGKNPWDEVLVKKDAEDKKRPA